MLQLRIPALVITRTLNFKKSVPVPYFVKAGTEDKAFDDQTKKDIIFDHVNDVWNDEYS
jgi:hypothetical protein